MDSGSTRVEIELEPKEPKEPKRSRRRAAPPPEPSVLLDAPPTLVDGDVQPSYGVPRNQVVITALAVGLVAFVLGWVVGRAGGDGDAPAAAPVSAPSATPAPTTSGLASRPVTGEMLPAAELPTTPSPRRTSAAQAAWTESAVTIDPRLAGQTDRLIGVTQDGDVVDLGLDGTLRVLTSTLIGGDVAQSPPIAAADWILLRSPSGAWLLQGESPEPVAIPISDASTVLWQYGTDRFWTWAGFGSGDTDLVEVGVSGERTGRVLSVAALFPFTTDPAGGVVAGDIGAFFTLDDAGSALLPGLPVAMGESHIVVYACGDTVDECGLRLVDRSTSQWRPVPGAPGSGRYTGWLGNQAGTPGVTGDGGAALFPVSEDDGSVSVRVVDVATGEERRFEYLDPSNIGVRPSGVWSADERFAYVIDEGVLTAFDRTTGDSFPVVVPGVDETEFRALDRLVSVTRRVET